MNATVLMLAAIGLAGVAAFLFGYATYPQQILAEARQAAPKLRQGLALVVLGKLAPINEAFLSEKRRAQMGKLFIMMGRTDLRPIDFVAFQQFSFLLFSAVGALLVSAVGVSWWWALAPAALGVLYPLIWVRDQIKKRHMAITRALPYNLDLLTLAVEAGLDFASAVGTVVQRGRPGPLNEEFALMLNEIRMGKTREEALRNLSERVGLTALSQFVSNLIQADKMGTSLGKILRIQSSQMRIDRTQRAEKLANEAPVKLIFPLVACIFPTVFMVLFSPILYRCSSGDF